MTKPSSLVIRGGTIIDGNGGAPFVADVLVLDGKIAKVGTVTQRGEREIDATGKLVTPGFVDIHTHYDGQAIWSNRIDPSSWHGVTTIMMGNCGVGFAPCKPKDRDVLVALMEGVEDIPEVVITTGLDWSWETFPEYLDRLGERQFDVDVVTQVPHAAIRVFVMGDRGANREPATPEDMREMARLTVEGIKAGALGFSTSRAIIHQTLDGRHTPTFGAAEEELAVIAEAMGKAGAGWFQLITDFDDPVDEFHLLRRVAERGLRPMSLTLAQREGKDGHWKILLDLIAEANADGIPMWAQVMGRPIGLNFGFEISANPFIERPSYKAIAHLPFPERLAELRKPEVRAAILSEQTEDPAAKRRLEKYDRMFVLSDPPDYEPPISDSIAARAERMGIEPQALAYDTMLEGTFLYRPVTNYVDGNLDVCGEMMQHPNALMGLGDGGAHVSQICDSATVTHSVVHWTRDRTRGPKMNLPWVIQKLTRDPAAAIGLNDRGVLAPGYKADINVIDYDALKVNPLRVQYDFPSNGRRLMQDSEGYVATIVSGVVVRENGVATADLPGRLVRGVQQPDRIQLAAE
ncbi:N-acyl-D-amino-acid deacylase family protein [Reyranella sp.]|uniref:N-acyl-D-amino-acid deacylase family protein n=1 Tax=Reyranella sp. TaxID=1929291 RepID=UPI003D13BFB7